MSSTISPALKGLITAVIMIALSLILFYTNQKGDSYLVYLPYIVYALGIVWTLVAYRRSRSVAPKFKELFGQGFRCFIVITLVMVIFLGLFMKAHPEFKEENAKLYKEQMIREKSKLPAEIDAEIIKYKDRFNTSFVSASIFGYLIIGAVITAGCSAFLISRKQ